MSTRIATFAANSQLITYMMDVQRRLNTDQVQIATQQKSQTYSGIASSSERLIGLENTRDALDRFSQNNDLMDTRLNLTETTLTGIDKTMSDFRSALIEYTSGSMDDETRVSDIQEAAFRALTDMQDFLNTDVNGNYLFAGGRVTTKPVDLGLTTLQDFQAKYDGSTITYPTRRDTQVNPRLTAGTGFPDDPTAQGYGTLTFTNATDTITASNAGAFANIPVGSTFTIAGSGSGNDGTYTVASNDGTNIVVAETGSLTNEGPAATFTMAPDTSYYSGDTLATEHRVDQDRSFSLDLTAVNPAFEKAIRAMSIIAQGAFGTAGGLDQNTGRAENALYLMNVALDPTDPGNPPYGTEQKGNMESIGMNVAFDRQLLKQTTSRQQELISFYQTNTDKIEVADQTETISKMLADQNVLQASYQALAKIRSLSLTNFL